MTKKITNGSARKAFEEATAQALKAFEEATAQAGKAYAEAAAPAWKAYEEARAQAWEAYLQVKEVVTMTLDKAINQLKDIRDDGMFPKNQDDMYALNLGIEALKRCKAYKEAHFNLPYTPMPGETKDVK